MVPIWTNNGKNNYEEKTVDKTDISTIICETNLKNIL